VPVDDFEALVRALRTLGAVTNESAAGQDVTDEYVDLDARLGNLQATQARLRSFLDRATNVTETLTVDAELRRIEEEIEVIEGRMGYLAGRSAYSTIHLELNPWLPTPTATPTATATPQPTAEVWRPGDTAYLAAKELREDAQDAADFLIYRGITCGPGLTLLILVGLFLAGLYRGLRRWGNAPSEKS
jgi:hypothetical protein